MAKINESEKARSSPATTEEKQKALEAARLQIEKQYGSGALIQMGNTGTAVGIEVIPSGDRKSVV